MSVSIMSMVGMWVYIGVILAAIFAVFWIFGHRVDMNISTMILGFIAYFIFDAVLLNMVFDTIVVGTFSQGLYATVTTNPTVFVPYYSITRGLFYMLGMYIASRMSMRGDTSGGGFAIGIGFTAGFGIMNQTHGAWTVFQAWRSAMAINKEGGAEAYLAVLRSEGVEEAELEELRVSVDQLCNIEIDYYLVNTLETLLVLGTLFALAIIIHLAVTRRTPYYYLAISVVLFVLVMLPAALFLAGFLPGRWLYDILLVLCCGGTVALAAVLAKRYMHNPMKW